MLFFLLLTLLLHTLRLCPQRRTDLRCSPLPALERVKAQSSRGGREAPQLFLHPMATVPAAQRCRTALTAPRRRNPPAQTRTTAAPRLRRGKGGSATRLPLPAGALPRPTPGAQGQQSPRRCPAHVSQP